MTRERIGKDALSTLANAAALTGIGERRLRHDAVANVCGGAAVLAHYQREAGGAQDLGDWSAAVARYSGADDHATALRFARQVFKVIRSGEARTTNDGQRMLLRPSSVRSRGPPGGGLVRPAGRRGRPGRLPARRWAASGSRRRTSSTAPTPGDYGNHDLADRAPTWRSTTSSSTTPRRPGTPRSSWSRTRPTSAWHYSLRSSDGHIAQHVDAKDVAWHAGNWYVNMHSIGIEHEGFAAHGRDLVHRVAVPQLGQAGAYLADKYDIPLDRAHIIGHDQVPGTTPATVAGMHWDPGPYWDWEHYFDLLGAPIAAESAPRPTAAS